MIESFNSWLNIVIDYPIIDLFEGMRKIMKRIMRKGEKDESWKRITLQFF